MDEENQVNEIRSNRRRFLSQAGRTSLAAAALGAGCTKTGEKRVIKLGHALDRSHSVHKAMDFMAERLRAISSGKMDIEIYPSEQLGAERELVELLQLGSVGMTKVSAAVMESFAPEYKLFSIPYLFRSRAHQFAVLDGPVGTQLLAAGTAFRLRGLAYYDSGSRSFYTKARPIEKPSDLAGMKIRVMASATSIKMVEALGGAATPIPFGELYTALAQGVVDGAENNPPSFYLSRHYEVCKHYALDEHSSIPDVLLVGTSTWSSLSPQEQSWLSQAAQASVAYQRKLWAESEQEALDAITKAGVKVYHPDKTPFQKQVEPLHAAYRKDPHMAGLMDKIGATQP
jgi:tripartite ATP-independent transporter DctP family solute receptor